MAQENVYSCDRVKYLGGTDWNIDEKKEFEKDAIKIAEEIRDTGDFDRQKYKGPVHFITWMKGLGMFPHDGFDCDHHDHGVYIIEWWNEKKSQFEWVVLTGVGPR